MLVLRVKVSTPTDPDPLVVHAYDPAGRPVEIVVTVREVSKNHARVGISAPQSLKVNRAKLESEQSGRTPADIFSQAQAKR